MTFPYLTPFALSLSKGRPSSSRKGHGFDKLSPNGFSGGDI